MRVALIADVHANAVALEAVLSRLKTEQPDQIVCLGDVGTPGPDPIGAIERLRALNIPVVMGNWDEWLLQAHGKEGADAGIRWMRQIDDWIAGALSIILRRVPLDVKQVVQAAFDHDMVHAERWAALWG